MFKFGQTQLSYCYLCRLMYPWYSINTPLRSHWKKMQRTFGNFMKFPKSCVFIYHQYNPIYHRGYSNQQSTWFNINTSKSEVSASLGIFVSTGGETVGKTGKGRDDQGTQKEGKWVHKCIHIYNYTYIYTHIYIYIYMYVSSNVYNYIHTWLCIYVSYILANIYIYIIYI